MRPITMADSARRVRVRSRLHAPMTSAVAHATLLPVPSDSNVDLQHRGASEDLGRRLAQTTVAQANLRDRGLRHPMGLERLVCQLKAVLELSEFERPADLR